MYLSTMPLGLNATHGIIRPVLNMLLICQEFQPIGVFRKQSSSWLISLQYTNLHV